jgi:ABC-2 type transport system ATP-binding protein
MPMNVIEFSHVSKIYRKGFLAKKIPAVLNLSFAVRQGAITGFVGPNGAGKTTSIKMIMGLVRPSGGVLQLSGRDPRDPASRADCAFLPEQPYFYQHLTVSESLAFAARLYGVRGGNLARDIGQTLETLGLGGLEKRKIKELSKGMQQRLAMAQALLMRSNVLIFDEPMSGMDPPGRNLFRSIFLSLAGQGKTIFFSTHILDDIEALCSDVVVLSKGRLDYQGPIDTLLQKGFKGHDLVVAHLPDALKEELGRMGCTIEPHGATGDSVFVPPGIDLAACQRRLQEHGMFCESLTKRTISLEDVLYKKQSG